MMWYFAEGERQQGPVSLPDLIKMIHAGKLQPETLVWQQGMENWRPLREIPELNEELPTPLRDLPPPPDTVVNIAQTQSCEDGAATPMTTSATPAATVFFQPGGFWRRFLAHMLDGLITSIVCIPLAIILGMIIGISSFLIQDHPLHMALRLLTNALSTISGWVVMAVYNGYFLSAFGATPGKMALGLQVVSQDGTRLTFMRGVCRFLAEILSSLLCGIGYLMVLFNERKLALHDQICKTQVIEK